MLLVVIVMLAVALGVAGWAFRTRHGVPRCACRDCSNWAGTNSDRCTDCMAKGCHPATNPTNEELNR